jgi:hypothetical protein
MIKYGQIIDSGFEPSKIHIYNAFVEYYKNPIFTKIKNINGFSVYMVKIYAMLGNAYRYLILFVTQDINPLQFTTPMKNIEWISLQTRTLEDHHKLSPYIYRAESLPPLNQLITAIERDDEKCVYTSVDYPLSITLLNTKKNCKYQYQEKGTIASALETFQTIINFK